MNQDDFRQFLGSNQPNKNKDQPNKNKDQSKHSKSSNQKKSIKNNVKGLDYEIKSNKLVQTAMKKADGTFYRDRALERRTGKIQPIMMQTDDTGLVQIIQPRAVMISSDGTLSKPINQDEDAIAYVERLHGIEITDSITPFAQSILDIAIPKEKTIPNQIDTFRKDTYVYDLGLRKGVYIGSFDRPKITTKSLLELGTKKNYLIPTEEVDIIYNIINSLKEHNKPKPVIPKKETAVVKQSIPDEPEIVDDDDIFADAGTDYVLEVKPKSERNKSQMNYFDKTEDTDQADLPNLALDFIDGDTSKLSKMIRNSHKVHELEQSKDKREEGDDAEMLEFLPHDDMVHFDYDDYSASEDDFDDNGSEDGYEATKPTKGKAKGKDTKGKGKTGGNLDNEFKKVEKVYQSHYGGTLGYEEEQQQKSVQKRESSSGGTSNRKKRLKP
ncbi:hypothetical protein BC833DRAFT_294120 [Globomyces pollinis-pini]|nr:hypothetical protein BC833DRAFT_294120 [Globomyces pollinis-pini]